MSIFDFLKKKKKEQIGSQESLEQERQVLAAKEIKFAKTVQDYNEDIAGIKEKYPNIKELTSENLQAYLQELDRLYEQIRPQFEQNIKIAKAKNESLLQNESINKMQEVLGNLEELREQVNLAFREKQQEQDWQKKEEYRQFLAQITDATDKLKSSRYDRFQEIKQKFEQQGNFNIQNYLDHIDSLQSLYQEFFGKSEVAAAFNNFETEDHKLKQELEKDIYQTKLALGQFLERQKIDTAERVRLEKTHPNLIEQIEQSTKEVVANQEEVTDDMIIEVEETPEWAARRLKREEAAAVLEKTDKPKYEQLLQDFDKVKNLIRDPKRKVNMEVYYQEFVNIKNELTLIIKKQLAGYYRDIVDNMLAINETFSLVNDLEDFAIEAESARLESQKNKKALSFKEYDNALTNLKNLGKAIQSDNAAYIKEFHEVYNKLSESKRIHIEYVYLQRVQSALEKEGSFEFEVVYEPVDMLLTLASADVHNVNNLDRLLYKDAVIARILARVQKERKQASFYEFAQEELAAVQPTAAAETVASGKEKLPSAFELDGRLDNIHKDSLKAKRANYLEAFPLNYKALEELLLMRSKLPKIEAPTMIKIKLEQKSLEALESCLKGFNGLFMRVGKKLLENYKKIVPALTTEQQLIKEQGLKKDFERVIKDAVGLKNKYAVLYEVYPQILADLNTAIASYQANIDYIEGKSSQPVKTETQSDIGTKTKSLKRKNSTLTMSKSELDRIEQPVKGTTPTMVERFVESEQTSRKTPPTLVEKFSEIQEEEGFLSDTEKETTPKVAKTTPVIRKAAKTKPLKNFNGNNNQ